jgi:hypothetical protein
MGDIDVFLHRFNYIHVERSIARDNFSRLQEPYYSRLENLLNRGRDIGIPDHIFRIMIICDEQYGVMLFWWSDTMSFGNFPARGEVLMFRHFFRLNTP